MRKIYLFLLTLLCAVGASAENQTLARMSDLVGAATNANKPTAESLTDWTCEVYPFNGSQYFGGITYDAVANEFEGTGYVTVAAWVYQEAPVDKERCIFSYGVGSTGWKFQLKKGKPEIVSKGKVVYSNSSATTFETGKWYLVAYAVPGSTNSVYDSGNTPKCRLYVGTTNNSFWPVNLNTGNDKVVTPTTKTMSIGSSQPSSLSEEFHGKIAKLTVIKSDAFLNNSDIATIVGERPVNAVAELNSVITTIESHIDETKIGYYSHSVVDDKLAEANALVNSDSRTYEALTTMKAELEALPTNLPVESKFYCIKSTAPVFASSHGLYVKKVGEDYQLYHHDFPTHLTAADVFQITPTGEQDTYRISNILDGIERNVGSAGYVKEARINLTATSDKTYALRPTSTFATFYLRSDNGDCTLNGAEQSTLSDAEKADGPVRSWNMYDGSDPYNQWSIEEVPAYMLSVSEVGYATLYLDYATTIPAGVEVYTGSRSGSKLNLAAVSENLPADEGVVVKANAGSYVFVKTDADVADIVTNELTGTVTTQEVNESAYVLSKPEGQEVGFYRALEAGGKWQNNANRAYLPVGTGGDARFLTFNFDDNAETGINAVEIEEAAPANAAIYDLSGRRVQSAKSGLYIINGKKVIK